jgi:outer membrane receptor protein involved in Fe transport
MIKTGANSLRLFVLLSLTLSYAPPATSQTTTTGALRGQVHEAGTSGKGIGGATLVVTNNANGLSRSVEADGSGNFFLATLPSALYTINVTAPGYESQIISDFAVRISKANELDVPLKQGTVNQSVTVQATYEGATITKSSQIIGGFTTRQVAELPSNVAGTGVDTLALLLPGVTPGFGNVNSNGTPLSVSGNRVVSNNFNIDGQDNNDQFLGGQVYFVDNQDLVADYQIITSNPLAQFGRNQGAIVNIVTKSGTNDLHGTAFWFHRDRSLFDSRTNFERRDGKKINPLLYNVLGGTVGGPIVKDRVFFFGSYQGVTTRETLTIESFFSSFLPEDASRLKSAFPGNAAVNAVANFSGLVLNDFGSVRIDPKRSSPFQIKVGDQFYNAFFTERTFPFSDETPYNQNELSMRGDIKVSDKDSVWARYLFQNAIFKNFLAQFDGFSSGSGSTGDSTTGKSGLDIAASSSDGFTGDLQNRSHYFGGDWNHQFSGRALNDLSISASTTSNYLGGGCEGLKGCIPSPKDNAKSLAFVAVVGPFLRAGPSGNFPFGHTSRIIQFRDNYSIARGDHQMLFGADVRTQNVAIYGLPNSNGTFSFNTPARFAPASGLFFAADTLSANTADSFSLRVGPDAVRYNEVDQFYFFQDDWRVRENLTLNLGLRYEYIGQPFNKLHDLTVKRESDPSAALWKQSLPLEDRTVSSIDADRNNWAPRVGFAYTPRFWKKFLGEDSTVIRGGYSIAYEPPTYIIARDIASSAPTAFLSSAFKSSGAVISVPTSTPSGVIVRAYAAANSLVRTNLFDPRDFPRIVVPTNLHSPYAQQWSLGIQRRLGKNNIAEIRYLGSHAVGLYQVVDRNPFIDGLANGGSINFCTNRDSSFKCTSTTTVDFPSFKNLLPAGVKAQSNGFLLPNSGSLRSFENTGQSTYHSLQSRYSGQLLHQLTLGAAYTFSKNLDNVSEIRSILESFFVREFELAQNPFDINKGEHSYSELDRRHVLALNAIWDIPFLKEQKGIVGRLLGGWQINGIYLLSSGLRYTPATFADAFYSFEPLRAFNGNVNADARTVGITDVDMALFFGQDLQPSPTGFYSMNEFNKTGKLVPVSLKDVRFVLTGPGAAKLFGTPFGDVARNSLVGPRINVLNTGFFKNTRIGERMTIQFRTEVFNLLNHPNPGYGFIFSGKGSFDSRARPDRILDDAGLGFNDRTEMEYGRRVIQFGLRFVF